MPKLKMFCWMFVFVHIISYRGVNLISKSFINIKNIQVQWTLLYCGTSENMDPIVRPAFWGTPDLGWISVYPFPPLIIRDIASPLSNASSGCLRPVADGMCPHSVGPGAMHTMLTCVAHTVRVAVAIDRGVGVGGSREVGRRSGPPPGYEN